MMYKFTNTVNLIVELLDNLALVIVYPFAISKTNVRNVISLAPINSVPNVVFGPRPVKPYLAYATPWSSMPIKYSTTLNANSR